MAVLIWLGLPGIIGLWFSNSCWGLGLLSSITQQSGGSCVCWAFLVRFGSTFNWDLLDFIQLFLGWGSFLCLDW